MLQSLGLKRVRHDLATEQQQPYSTVDFWSLSGKEVKNLPANAGDAGLIPGLRNFPWRRKQQPTPVLLPGKSHGQRSVPGYHP